MKLRPLLTFLLFLLCLILAWEPIWAEVDDPLLKGNRILAIKVNLGEDGDFDQAFKMSLKAGSQTQVVPLDWNTFEVAPGLFKPTVNFLAIANRYYPAHKMPIHLALRPLHTNQKVVPSDLIQRPFDDPQTIHRFKKLLDWIATQIPDVELTSLVIGAEIDIFMWGNKTRWQEWIHFYAAVAPYARKVFPGTLIASETTHGAFTGTDLERVRKLHQYSDAIGVSYYPMKPGLKGVLPPMAVHNDFGVAANAISGKPIIYYQIGYPSSTQLDSSEEQQAGFVSEAFRAWDQYAGRILMLNFQWMHEIPPFGLDQFAEYYQHDSPEFRAFLGSLGLRGWSGQAKPAWLALKKEARRRGFVE